LCGLAPKVNDSGKSHGYRTTRKNIHRVIHISINITIITSLYYVKDICDNIFGLEDILLLL
ncbi:MAG: hypothetical protein LBE97_02710, partial [Holosporales bacterium]|nr:hypothetical protein [Holosporales bacterium]